MDQTQSSRIDILNEYDGDFFHKNKNITGIEYLNLYLHKIERLDEKNIMKFLSNNSDTLTNFYLRIGGGISWDMKTIEKIIFGLNEIACQYIISICTDLDDIDFDDIDFKLIETDSLKKIHQTNEFQIRRKENGHRSTDLQIRKYNQLYLLTTFCESLTDKIFSRHRLYRDRFKNSFVKINDEAIHIIFQRSNLDDCEHIWKLIENDIEKIKTNKNIVADNSMQSADPTDPTDPTDSDDNPIPKNDQFDISRSKKYSKEIKNIKKKSNYTSITLDDKFIKNYEKLMQQIVDVVNIRIDFTLQFDIVYQILFNNKKTLQYVIITSHSSKETIDLTNFDKIILLLNEINCSWDIEISCWHNDFLCETILDRKITHTFVKKDGPLDIKAIFEAHGPLIDEVCQTNQYKKLYHPNGYMSTEKKIREYNRWYLFRKWLESHTPYYYELEPSGYGDIRYQLMNEKMKQYVDNIEEETDLVAKSQVERMERSDRVQITNQQYLDKQKLLLNYPLHTIIKQPYRNKIDIFERLCNKTNIQKIKTEVNRNDSDFNMDTICLVLINNKNSLEYFNLTIRNFPGVAQIEKLVSVLNNIGCQYVIKIDTYYDYGNINYDDIKFTELIISDQIEQIHNTNKHKRYYQETFLSNNTSSWNLSELEEKIKQYNRWYKLIRWCDFLGNHNYIENGSFKSVTIVLTNFELDE